MIETRWIATVLFVSLCSPPLLAQTTRTTAPATSRPQSTTQTAALTVPTPATTAPPAAEPKSEPNPYLSLYVEEAMVLATAIGAIVCAPILIEFLVDRRKRKERIALSIEVSDVESLKPRLAGLDDLLESIADLIDRAQHPKDYQTLRVGNEILIIGGQLSGKKTLAAVIAKRAELDRLITVYNPRNADALAKAKSLISRYRDEKVMLLLPSIDLAFDQEDEEVQAELEALIESTSGLANVLVIGTATALVPDSALDNLFGIKLVLPGPALIETQKRKLSPRATRVLEAVCRFYLDEARQFGCVLADFSAERFEARVMSAVTNAAEIEDIVTLCETTALHRRRIGQSDRLAITPDILETSISRVIVSQVKAD
ncbi:MAG: hypothetical protein ACHRHE_03260 [Tepidisphaerales bacterium]